MISFLTHKVRTALKLRHNQSHPTRFITKENPKGSGRTQKRPIQQNLRRPRYKNKIRSPKMAENQADIKELEKSGQQ
jgi:hypothetical protein